MTDTVANSTSPWLKVGSTIKTTALWIWKKLLAPGAALAVAVLGVVLLSMGAKNLQIGGILQKLLNGWKKADPSSPDPAIVIANQIPDGRVDPSGKLIPQGTPDAGGVTQAVVVPIQSNGGLFSNPRTVTVTPPNEKPIQVPLPSGVKASDVDKVVVVQPGQFVVTVKDSSGIPAQSIDDVLNKYGG